MATIEGTPGNDRIIVEGNDESYSVNAYTGTDVIEVRTTTARWTSIHLEDGGDTVHGGEIQDNVQFTGGDNRLYGGGGDDDFSVSGLGAGNLIDGGAGSDTFRLAGSGDGAFITLAEGRAAVRSEHSGLMYQYDLRDIENLTDTPGNDILVGNDEPNLIETAFGDDLLSGRGGDDEFRSYDEIEPGSGNDTFVGGLGADRIHTANGVDTIRIDRLVESLPGREDVVMDFSVRDILDVSRIDADQTAPGNQAFAFIGDAAFSGTAGELRYQRQGDGLVVSADADGDREADMAVVLEPPAFQQLTRITAEDVLL
ncbi:M10 family metallopeptidase C-terminal domain-containing protein [Inquilinus sp. NPDC058860]|uniref:M10 family metallopeptidase C-terminal domain-containing protein n=1 Tax=Inquilinus sp. NPDC058860 TaxID=3346652 RepID=UPI0036B814F3